MNNQLITKKCPICRSESSESFIILLEELNSEGLQTKEIICPECLYYIITQEAIIALESNSINRDRIKKYVKKTLPKPVKISANAEIEGFTKLTDI